MRFLSQCLCALLGSFILIISYQQHQLRQQPSTAYWIAFTSNMDGAYEIYRVLPDGRQLKRLTFDNAHNWQPAWSPDGGSIAYSSYQDGNFLLYHYQIQAGESVPVSFGDDRALDHLDPIWSKDGQSILYRATTPNRNSNFIYQTDIHDYVPEVLVSNTVTQNGFYGFASWSPDETQLGIHAREVEDWSIYLLDPATQTEKYLTFSGSRANIAPQWSPDGRHLAYFHAPVWEQSHLHTVDIETGEVQQIGRNQGLGLRLMWSPDGKWIIYDEWISGSYHIHLANIETGQVERLTPQASVEHSPSWSPDGKWIAFVKSFGEDNEAIFIMRPDGTDRQRLTTQRGLYETPVWSPAIDLEWNLGLLSAIGISIFFSFLLTKTMGKIQH